jgi:hypothetical protein
MLRGLRKPTWQEVIDLPPGFSKTVDPDNGDGGIWQAGDQKLTIWGTHLVLDDQKFDDGVRSVSSGWTQTYFRKTNKSASSSGIWIP